MIYLYGLWAIVLFDPHRWLGTIGPNVFHRLMAVMFVPVIVMIVLEIPNLVARARGWALHPPLLAYLSAAAIGVFFAFNPAKAHETVQGLFIYYLLMVSTLLFARAPRDAVPILFMFLVQYLWWAFHGKDMGQVLWHPLYENTDGFGPLMVIGMPISFYFGLAARSKKLKWLGILLSGYCVFGVVASFARGAVLSAIPVTVLIWLRAPRKLLTAGGVALGMLIVIVSSSILHPGGTFWEEMESAFVEGKDEGTGRDRWELWKASLEVFAQKPVFGVGGGNFGPYAANAFDPGDIIGYENPGRLYDRNLHSVYFQVLCEFGALGSVFFLWILFHFWRRNRALREGPALDFWSRTTGGAFDLRYISIGLEIAMVGYLATGLFYAQLYAHWAYTLLAVNAMLYALVYRRGRARSTRLPEPVSSAAEPNGEGPGRRAGGRRYRPSVVAPGTDLS